MAFDPLQTSLFVGANGNSLWYYKSAADNHAAIIAANYFAPYAPVMNVGDVIFIHDSAGTNDMVFVKTTDGISAITVAAGLAAPVIFSAGEGTKEALAAAKAKAAPKNGEPRDETPAEQRRRERLEQQHEEEQPTHRGR